MDAKKSRPNPTKSFEFALIPYIKLTTPIKIGRVFFWPYNDLKQSVIKDAEAIARTDRLVSLYKTYYKSRPINSVVAVNIQIDDQNQFDGTDEGMRTEIISAANLLAYSCLSRRSPMLPFAYENFIPNFYSSNLEKNTGSITLYSRLGFHMMDLDDANVQAPYYLYIQDCTKGMDEDLLRALSQLFLIANEKNDPTSTEARRIMRSILWYNKSYYADPFVQPEDMFISLGVALETLLNIQQFSRKANELTNAIQLLLGQRIEIANWVSNFYNTRSKIVHGEEVKSFQYSRSETSHLLLAQIVFDYCLKVKLHLLGLFKNEAMPLFWLNSIEYYLGSNKERVEKIGEYNLSRLKKSDEAKAFITLSLSLNTDTDQSGDEQLYQKSIISICQIILEGLAEIEKQKKKYQSAIANFEQQLKSLKDTLNKIAQGEIELAQQLKYIDIYTGDQVFEFKPEVKHLEIAYGLLITNFFHVIEKLYELWHLKKHGYMP